MDLNTMGTQLALARLNQINRPRRSTCGMADKDFGRGQKWDA